MKASGEQLDERIVEVYWDPEQEHWRMMRFRDDKPKGNFKSVVENIIQSIADGVEKDAVCVHLNAPVIFFDRALYSDSVTGSFGIYQECVESQTWSRPKQFSASGPSLESTTSIAICQASLAHKARFCSTSFAEPA